ncbi:MAG: DUF3108 domain-containing protein [Bacteriovoracaceae bacterium]|nr:DUF3108 domain-containing protein [Bacteroidota bacterium]
MGITPRNVLLCFGSVVTAMLLILLAPVSSSNTLEAKNATEVVFEFSGEDDQFFLGEELQYNVSYSIFDIGLVKMQILDTAVRNGVKVFKAKAYLDSYSGIPFVDLHQVFYSEMDADAYSQFFVTHNTSKPTSMPYVKYSYNYKKNKMYYEIGVDPIGEIIRFGEEPIFEQQLDGLSLFFYARQHFKQVRKYSVPVVVNEKSYKTHFNFMNKMGSQDIDAVKYPVATIEFDGTSDFTGVFGLTGYFQGYFSNDTAGIPIVAKMKVILGSVHVELIKWTRQGWIPPHAN